MLQEGEKLEPLGNGVRVIVSKNHAFGTDTVLLAHFSQPHQNDIACELGTGCGAIPLIWSRNGVPKAVTAVDIQPEACYMLRRSVALNGFGGRITVVESDLCDLKGKAEAAAYDLVVCNPPYKAAGTGLLNPATAHRIARHEMLCTLDDITRVSAKLLKYGGKLCMCQRPERLSDMIESMRKSGIEPKRLRFVQQRITKAPKLFLLEGRRGGRPGGLLVEPALLIENNDGTLTDEMIRIYGAYKEAYLT